MTFALTHNGGRSQVNPNYLQVGGDFPFLNHLKTAQSWGAADNSANSVLPSDLDADGYPTIIRNGGVGTVFYVPTQAKRPGNYVVTGDGNGTVQISGTPVSGSLTSTTGSLRCEFSTTDDRMILNIVEVGSPHLTNLKVFHVDDEAAINAGEVFGTKFKQRLIEANFGVIRFLNWQTGNTTNVTDWASRKALTHWSYYAQEFRPGLYAGETSRSGTAFSVAAPSTWSGLVDKATVIIHAAHSTYANIISAVSSGTDTILTISQNAADFVFSAGQTITINEQTGTGTWGTLGGDGTSYTISAASAGSITIPLDSSAFTGTYDASSAKAVLTTPVTLNVGGTGAKNVLSEYSEPLGHGGNSYFIGNSWQSLATLVYDAAIDAWIKQGADDAAPGTGLNNGCPPELMVRLCAEVGAHPHFVSPPFAMDPFTDYMSSLATYCRDNGPSWMVPCFEGPNELWNTFGGFYQTHYAQAKATAYHASDAAWSNDTDNNYHDWYGKVMSVLGQALSTVYGGDRSKYECVAGVQTAFGSTLSGCAASDHRLDSTSYLAQSAAAQSPFIKSAASNWVTAICVANYYNPIAESNGDLATDVANYVAAAPGAPKQAVANAYSDSVADPTLSGFTLADVANRHNNWKTWAISKGINKMRCYEGGYSPDYTGDADADAMRKASKNNPNLETYNTTNYNNFVNLTGGGFVAEYPSLFQLAGSVSDGVGAEVWSVLEDIYQTPDPPMWLSIVAFNEVSGGGGPPPPPATAQYARPLSLHFS